MKGSIVDLGDGHLMTVIPCGKQSDRETDWLAHFLAADFAADARAGCFSTATAEYLARCQAAVLERTAAPSAPPVLAEEPADDGPRTYQCLWRWHEGGAALLQTAEEWLREEADIDAKLDAAEDDDGDGLSRGGILAAIANEIATLRRERSQWAAQATSLIAQARQGREDAERLRSAGDNLVRATSPGEDERFRARARQEWFIAASTSLAATHSPSLESTEGR